MARAKSARDRIPTSKYPPIPVFNFPWTVDIEVKEPVKLGRNGMYIKIFIRPVLGEELYKSG